MELSNRRYGSRSGCVSLLLSKGLILKAWGPPDLRYIVAGVIVLCATLLYAIGLIVAHSNPIEPDSVFTLYGAVLGYLFGRFDKKRNGNGVPGINAVSTSKESPQHDPEKVKESNHVVPGTKNEGET